MGELCVAGGQIVIDHIARVPALPAINSVLLRADFHRDLQTEYLGGCTCNMAAAAAKLGVNVHLSCMSGCYRQDNAIMAVLQDCLGTLNYLIPIHDKEICHCYQIYDDAHDKLSIMDAILEPDTVDAFSTNDGERPLLCLALPNGNRQIPSLCALIRRTVEQGFPVGLSMTSTPKLPPKEMLEAATYLFMNDFEANLLKGLYGVSGDISFLLDCGIQAVFVTHGADGILLYDRDTPSGFRIPALPVASVVDTTGAGDGFAGGTMTALIWGASHRVAAQIGAVVSSFVLERMGAQTGLPNFAQLKARYENYYGTLEAPIA